MSNTNRLERNVLGTNLIACCTDPMTGYFRDGFCRTVTEDSGTHVVCAILTDEFLAFTKSQGNDLSRAMPYWNFPGLKTGDKWCLCISRWLQAEKNGVAPKIMLNATHEKALQFVTLEKLKLFAIDL